MTHPMTAGDGGRGERPPPPASTAWQEEASCAGVGGDHWFPGRGQPSEEAKAICAACPVKAECLEYALTFPFMVGVWGGTTEHERRKLRPQNYTSRRVAMTEVEKRRAEVRRLHATGLLDTEIAVRMNLAADSVGRIRRRLGLAPNTTSDLTPNYAREYGARRRKARKEAS